MWDRRWRGSSRIRNRLLGAGPTRKGAAKQPDDLGVSLVAVCARIAKLPVFCTGTRVCIVFAAVAIAATLSACGHAGADTRTRSIGSPPTYALVGTQTLVQERLPNGSEFSIRAESYRHDGVVNSAISTVFDDPRLRRAR